MIVVYRESTFPTTTTAVALSHTANGASAILLVKKGLILLSSASLPAGLNFAVQLSETVAATILPATERRKLILG